MIVATAAAVLWYLFGSARPGVPAAVPAAAITTAPSAVAVAPAAATTPIPTIAPPPAAVATPPVSPPIVPLDSERPRAGTTPSPTPGAEPARTTPARQAAPRGPSNTEARTPARATSPASTIDPAQRIYAIHELPDDIRRALPALNVGGSMYSNAPSDRILILNGMILHEGEKFNAELAVQQIRLKSAVLVFRGYRYELTY